MTDITIVSRKVVRMIKNLETVTPHASDGIVTDRMLRDGKINSRRGKSAKRSRNNCNNIKPGFHGATKVSSDSHNRTGEVIMNNDTDVNQEMMQVKIDSNEKVISAGLAGHKAELAGHKESVDGRFEATRELINGNQKAILGEFKSIRAEFRGALKAIQEQFKVVHTEIQAVRTENKQQNEATRAENKLQNEALRSDMNASISKLKVWLIISGIGLLVAGITIWRFFFNGD